MKLYLKKSHYNTILEHCTAGLPNESCGLLAGREEDVYKRQSQGTDEYIAAACRNFI